MSTLKQELIEAIGQHLGSLSPAQCQRIFSKLSTGELSELFGGIQATMDEPRTKRDGIHIVPRYEDPSHLHLRELAARLADNKADLFPGDLRKAADIVRWVVIVLETEPVATVLGSDPNDERDGFRATRADWANLDQLPAKTQLIKKPVL